jgi:hypothetical protein
VRAAETMTAGKAARIARKLVEGFKHHAATGGVPVLHCKLATPRQRYLCADARPWTPGVVAAEILAGTRASERGGNSLGATLGTRCVVQSEDGDLWTIAAGGGRCWF